jgi:anti-sigma-K factor RskA
MTDQLTHSQIQRLLGAYALNAAEKSERVQIKSHLTHCSDCRLEIDELNQALAGLAEDERPARVEVWSRIEAALDSAPPPLNFAQISTPKLRRTIGARLAAAFAAGAIVVVAVLGAGLLWQGKRLAHLETTSAEEGLIRAAALAGADSRAVRVTLRSQNETLSADVVLLPNGEGYLVSHNLPKLKPDRDYQLWALSGETRISLGLVGPAGVTAFRAPKSTVGLAVTEEPAGGVSTSTRAPVVVGSLKT